MTYRLFVTSLVSGLILTGSTRADVDFSKDIQPILVASCLKCHGEEKPKAGLRLDTREATLEGSKGGEVVVVGKPDESILYERITLPDDDPLRMPPDGKPLPQDQQDKLRDWIKEGMKWPDGLVLKDPNDPGKPKGGVDEKGLPVTEEEKAALAKLQGQTGTLAMRLAQNTNWLRVDFSLGAKEVPSESLAVLAQMPNLIELNLGGTDITDDDLAHLKDLKNLQKLYLQRTAITDKGLEHLKGLAELRSLNLYGTEVTDKGLEHLKGLKKLSKVYLWESKATKDGANNLVKEIPGLEVNLGFEEPPPAEETKPEPEEKK